MDLPLTEFEPLTRVIQAIPRKAQRGLFTNWVEWTCIDVTREYIAVGSDVGIVFLVDRTNNTIQRLNCKIRKNEAISTVKMCYSVDYVVAVGTMRGSIYIFQLPSILPGRPKELRQFTVSDMHHSAVRALSWSQNAMKLYSGDEDGVVVCTEINYDDGQSTSYLVCKEPHEIVQLDYMYRTLLISTRFCCLLCFTEDNNRTEKLGTKDRKMLGQFGATFVPGIAQPSEAIIFSARPGLRLWRATMEAKVQSTFMFKELVQGQYCDIDLLEDTPQKEAGGRKAEERQFGQLHIYQETQLVTWHDTALYVVDPGLAALAGYHTALGKIRGVAVCEDEIFVLREGRDRPILRIAQKPDLKLTPVSPLSTPLLPSRSATVVAPSISGAAPVQLLQDTAATMSQSIVEAFKEVTDKLQAVQEGERPAAGVPPPWGSSPAVAGTASQGSNDSPDSAKEVSPVHTWPQTKSSTSEESKENANASEDISHEGAPGAPLTMVQQEEQRPPGSPPLEPSSSTPKQRPARKQKKEKVVDLDGNDDLIVSHKKVKKKKQGKDKDSGSVASLDIDTPPGTNSPRTGSPFRATASPKPSPLINRSKPKDKTAWPEAVVARPPSLDLSTTSSAYENEETIIIEDGDVVEDADLKRQRMLEELEKELTKFPPGFQDSARDTGLNKEEHINKSKLIKVETQRVNPFNDLTSDSITEQRNIVIEKESKEVQPLQVTAEKSGKTLTDSKSSVTIDDPQPGMSKESSSVLAKDERHKAGLSSPEEVVKPKQSPRKSATSKEPLDRTESVDDFYSQYKSMSPLSPSDMSIEDAMYEQDRSKGAKDKGKEEDEKVESSEDKPQDVSIAQSGDNWTEFVMPGNLLSICVNEKSVWIVDQAKKAHYSLLLGPGLRWQGIKELADQLTTSPSGSIVWRVHNKSLYVATKVSTRHPAGTKWVEAARDVAYAAVDENVGWYCKLNGDVVMQKDLSRDRPCYRATKVPCMDKVVRISCHRGVVWALTRDRQIIVRVGVTNDKPEGTDWEYLSGMGPSLLVSSFDLGAKSTAWVVELVGRVWFTTGVSASKPKGDGQWWQVSMSEFLMRDSTAIATLKTLLAAPSALASLVQKQENGGLIASRCNGVWVCPDFKNILHVCRQGIMGHQWEVVLPEGIVPSVKWRTLMAEGAEEEQSLIWSQQPNASLFCFSGVNQRLIEVTPPLQSQPQPFKVLTGNAESVWGLMNDGSIYIRTGIGTHCKQGIKWTRLDLAQLGNVNFVHIWCGTQNVWGVSKEGQVFLRIGTMAPTKAHLNPVWVPVEGSCNTVGAKFVKVYSGPNDWMVWAVDSKNCVYVRKGITDAMPIGTHWLYVAGVPSVSLCLSEQSVYALAASGEILMRHSVSHDMPAGSHWTKIPGAMASITVTQHDELWGINKEKQLCRRFTHFQQMRRVLSELKGTVTRGQSVDEDWELL